MVQDLSTALAQAGYKDTPTLFLLRFLKVSNFDAEAALPKAIKFIKFYLDNNVASDSEAKQPATQKIMEALIPHSVNNGFDNKGSPVYIELTGRIRAGAMSSNISVDEFLRNHAWGMQVQLANMERSSKKLNKPIKTFAIIMDLEGLDFSFRHGVSYLLKTLAFDNEMYPGVIGKVYVVNLNWVFPMAFRAVKPFLPSVITDAIELVGGDSKTELQKYFPKETLPPRFGGTGPEVKMPDESVLKSAAAATADGEELEECNISAGDQLELVVDAENAAGTFGWYFVSEGGYDVGFSVKIEEKGGEIVELRKYAKLTTDKGTYTSKGPCKLTFTWDNSYSLFTSKTIKYYASVAEVAADAKEAAS